MRRKQLLAVLEQTEDPAYPELVREMIAELDFERGFFILQDCMGHLRDLGEWETALRAFQKKHGKLAAGVAATLEESVRRDVIKELRSTIAEPEHRFFLALLMNVPDAGRSAQAGGAAVPEGGSGGDRRALGGRAGGAVGFRHRDPGRVFPRVAGRRDRRAAGSLPGGAATLPERRKENPRGPARSVGGATEGTALRLRGIEPAAFWSSEQCPDPRIGAFATAVDLPPRERHYT